MVLLRDKIKKKKSSQVNNTGTGSKQNLKSGKMQVWKVMLKYI